MKTVNYILVAEAGTQNAACVIRNCKLPDIGHCVICDAGSTAEVSEPGGPVSGSKFQISGFKDLELETRNLEQRGALIRELCRLRRRFPEAKILGVSEIDGKRIRVSDEMNALRRALSDLP